MQKSVRVRFAPSPTGALHIGGVRTALYNYLFAKNNNGTFILRIEDTDQGRYVPGAEDYIRHSLEWCGLHPDEGPGYKGDYGPYRQSERKTIYKKYAEQLVASGHAYYAFDTIEDLEQMRIDMQAAGLHSPTYNAAVRMKMKNSLSLSAEETSNLLANGTPFTIRLKVPEGETVVVEDIIRGEVSFSTDELDDKVLLKADGMPTYHMANVVDDHLMDISHVIRGEEWLSSTAHHVLLYHALGIDEPPVFAHLPLILKPTGKGKLSKRDGQKMGFPVFPMEWKDDDSNSIMAGFKEYGFLPEAVVNFLAFLGWNPGTEQEIFSLEELTKEFSLEKVSKSGSRFDYEKALWYNQQYLKNSTNEFLAAQLQPYLDENKIEATPEFVSAICGLMKERVSLIPEILQQAGYFFESITAYDTQTLHKKFKPEAIPVLKQIFPLFDGEEISDAVMLEHRVKEIIATSGVGMGSVLPLLRIAMAGTLQGPDLFQMMTVLGSRECKIRLNDFVTYVKSNL